MLKILLIFIDDNEEMKFYCDLNQTKRSNSLRIHSIQLAVPLDLT